MGCGASSTPVEDPPNNTNAVAPAPTKPVSKQKPPNGSPKIASAPNSRAVPPPARPRAPATQGDKGQACEEPSPDEHPYPTEYKPLVATTTLGTFSTHGLMPKPVGMLPIKVNQDYGICVYPFLGRKDQMLLLVCDGHGEHGTEASSICTHAIVHALESSACMRDCAGNVDAVPGALVTAFDKAHEAVCDGIDAVKSGTTVVLCLIADKKMWTAHAGDSRAMIVKGSRGIVQLSDDHKPSSASERDRLVAAGGIVDLVMDGGRLCVIDMEAQKMLGLAVSRSVGDSIFHKYGCIHKPEIRLYESVNDLTLVMTVTVCSKTTPG
eukprot:TRINITY_DN8082_c0_g1_i2.p1 TRINITY_DN8082_c0_g1~~TRINITY_DN8082_c0_g1_i2.p1  ORF type:complete len:323 (-),score=38.96 TRINITY_DN8082_c0_g1_i2:844-1812(-)